MRVALVNMPFAAVRPAIGPSLLKAHLAAIGISAQVHYLNLRFARRLGTGEFAKIADRMPTQSLAGDWVFADSLYGARPEADQQYLEAYAERFGRYEDTAATTAMLRRARSLAVDFIAECVDDPGWAEYDVIGFTSTFTQHVAALALAQQLRRRYPAVVIAFGGANCEDVMGLTVHRTFPFVDYVLSGEADLSFPLLLSALRDGEDPSTIAGVISRSDGDSRYRTLTPDRVRHLDDLPVPDYDDFFAEVGSRERASTPVLMESSRGCWWGEKHHCTFCGLNGMAMTFRSKSAVRVLSEIETLTSRYRPASIEMVDNILDMGYFRDLLPELRDRQLRLGLFYETKANLSKQQVRELAAAGVTSIQPGIESFSTNVLTLMRKGTTALQNVQLLKWCKEIGLQVYWNLIYGFPGEDPADYAPIPDLIDAISHFDPPQGMGCIRLDRFSPNFVDGAALGLINVRPDRSYSYIYDQSAAELAGLAYYFEYDYLDGRRTADYMTATEAAMRRWYEQSGGRGLIYVDHGDQLAIWDFRRIAGQRLTVATGLERQLYLFCDEHRSASALAAYAGQAGARPETAVEIIQGFVEQRLMIEVDGRYLSLAVRTAPVPSGQAAANSSSLVF